MRDSVLTPMILLAGSLVIIVIAGVCSLRRILDRSHRAGYVSAASHRRRTRLTLGLLLVTCFVPTLVLAISGERWLLAAIMAAHIVFFVVAMVRVGLSAQQMMTNYGLDGRYCGRCEYDLTGNESGRCPECGWELPPEGFQWQRPDWALWWRQWQIDYLHDWKRTLRICLAMLTMGIVGTVLLACTPFAPLAVLPAAFALHFAINARRVWQYRCNLPEKEHTQ